MQSITSVEALHESIVALEIRRREQEYELTGHFLLIYDRLRPVNIIKKTVRTITESPDVQFDILIAAIKLGSRYLSRMLFVRSGPLNRILGVALQYGISNLMRKKGGAIKAGALHLLNGFLVQRKGNGIR